MTATDSHQWVLPTVVEFQPLQEIDLPLPLRAMLRRRGFDRAEVDDLIHPQELPDPCIDFPDLERAVERVCQACAEQEALAVCGDYDADGMTSTALLLRAFQPLGARPKAAIPSRMDEGYGLNPAMVNRLHAEGIRLLVTVDNGVAAREALERAQALDMDVIVTDHHTIPVDRPPMTALLHPATTPEGSPYRGLAGVGLAYVLAIRVAQQLDRIDSVQVARDLFCIGTVADMAPLTGANRRWLLEGLSSLHRSEAEGIKALQRLAGLGDRQLNADDIGFQLAPRINAVGRLGDPALVVDLLTESDPAQAMALARRCDDYNRQRRELCDAIEAEAIALLEAEQVDCIPPFLLLAQSHWHHGVIGIVAARLMERYHRPVALLAGDGAGQMRASARSPQGFALDEALNKCSDLLLRYGGHPAAGGFTIAAQHVHALHERLNELAQPWLDQQGRGRPLRPDACLRLNQVNWDLWSAMEKLQPFGIGHSAPLFWSRACRVKDWRTLNGGHLSLTLAQEETERRAIAWRCLPLQPMPELVDVAYELNVNLWKGERRLQLTLKALRGHQEESRISRGERRYNVSMGTPCEDKVNFSLCNSSSDVLKAHWSEESGVDSSDQRAGHPQIKTLLWEAALSLGLTP
ncbi:MAG: single-stranded-DNA-specific exonuclease RecJ [Synechococcus sp.]